MNCPQNKHDENPTVGELEQDLERLSVLEHAICAGRRRQIPWSSQNRSENPSKSVIQTPTQREKPLAVPVRLSAGAVLRFYHARLDSEDSLSLIRRWNRPTPPPFRLSPEIKRETTIRIRVLVAFSGRFRSFRKDDVYFCCTRAWQMFIRIIRIGRLKYPPYAQNHRIQGGI